MTRLPKNYHLHRHLDLPVNHLVLELYPLQLLLLPFAPAPFARDISLPSPLPCQTLLVNFFSMSPGSGSRVFVLSAILPLTLSWSIIIHLTCMPGCSTFSRFSIRS